MGIMDIVRESEGAKIKRNVMKTAVSDESMDVTSIKQEMEEDADTRASVVVEPPDEIISSPVSKLSIYKNNPDIKHVDNIKVKLLEELTQLSPGVSPPHSTSSSPSPSVVNFANGQKLKSVNRKIKETFILNPFKGKSDLIGPFKRLEPNSKVCTV